MKRTIVILILGMLIVGTLQADFHVGVRMGTQRINDQAIREIYGNSFIYSPFFRYEAREEWFVIEVAYEGGYSQEAPIGIFEENSVFSMYGFEVSVVLSHRISMIAPFLKFGFGRYYYKQEIDTEFIERPINESEWSYLFAGGLNIYLPEGFYLIGEFKFVPLNVIPREIMVDLGGYRITAGIGYSFSIQRKRNIRDVE